MLDQTRQLLAGAEWGDVADLLSPALFDTLPPTALASTASAVLAARLDWRGHREALRQRSRWLVGQGIGVVVDPRLCPDLPDDDDARRERGEALLRLYFHQVAVGGQAFLDLGPSRFAGSRPLAWSPSRVRHRWRPGFQSAVADLYAGFYEDERFRFDAALPALGIAPARDIFLNHFAGGDQRAVRFSLPDFRETFQAVFVACRDAGSRLHPDFLALGAMLTSLYGHLESLELAFDVRAAWLDAGATAAVAA